MKTPLFTFAVLLFGLMAPTGRADPKPQFVTLGHDTLSVTREAGTGFQRNTDALKAQALEDAAAYCANLHKEMKVVSVETKHPKIPLMGFAYAKVVFKALDANDPELRTPAAMTAPTPAEIPPSTATYATTASPAPAAPRSATDALYDDLMKLDDLRKRGILTDEEFQAQKKKLLEK